MNNWFQAYQAVVRREVRQIYAHKGLLFLVIAWPVIYAWFIGNVYSPKIVTRIPIAILDQDHSALSRQITRYLEATRGLEIRSSPDSPAKLEKLLAQAEAIAGVILPKGLQNDIKKGKGADIPLLINGSHLLAANIVQADIKTVIGTVAAGVRMKLLRKAGSFRTQALNQAMPVQLDVTRLFNPGLNYMNYLAPGLWFTALHQILLLLGALLMAREWDNGTWGSLVETSQKKSTAAIFGKMTPPLLIAFIVIEFYLRGFVAWYGIEFHGSVSLAAAMSIFFGIACLSLGTCIAWFAGDRIGALKGILLISSPAFLISGFSWPLEWMPNGIATLAHAIPLTSMLHIIRKIYMEGQGWNVIFPAVINLLVILVVSLIAIFVLWQKRLEKEGA